MRAFVVFVLVWCAGALRTAPSPADVDKLHKKLEMVAAGLDGMLASKDGALGGSKVGPELKLLVGELKHVLSETKAMTDPVAAMKKLQNAKAGLAGLTSELTSRQVALMKEDESQKDSLLLGVLLTRQKEPLEEQLKILRDGDFADLLVAKAVLAKHDNKTALYVQVAGYLDDHKVANSTEVVSQSERRAAAFAEVEVLAASFEKRIAALNKAHDITAKHHHERMELIKKDIEKAPKSAKALKALMKREERSFKKLSVVHQREVDTMKAALKAMKSHNLKALTTAKEALDTSERGLQAQNSGFLVLIDMGSQLMSHDCPYCAAQCVDKCHSEGKPYVACLTQCADAGKGK